MQQAVARAEGAVVGRDYYDIINKVASVKDLDIDKLQRLLQLQEDWEKRHAASHYNEQMALAQSEMTQISKDAVNPQTRSRYATLAALDAAIRPIYTKYGFSIAFNDETPPDRIEWLKLVAYVSCESDTRVFTKWLPVTGTGIRGQQMMTPTHAAIAAVTYGRRALLKMVFNLAEDDDDGNLAGARPQQQRRPAQRQEYVNPETGEVEEVSQEAREAFIAHTRTRIEEAIDYSTLGMWWNSPEQQQARRDFLLTPPEVEDLVIRMRAKLDALKNATPAA